MWEQNFFVSNHTIYNIRDLQSVLRLYGFVTVSVKQAIISVIDEIT